MIKTGHALKNQKASRRTIWKLKSTLNITWPFELRAESISKADTSALNPQFAHLFKPAEFDIPHE